MKSSKILILLFATIFFAATLNSCKKCKNQDPRAKISNNGTKKAAVQIKTSNGNTVNINNVDPGTSSTFTSFSAGMITFTISVSGIDYVKTVEMEECYEYDIAIDNANNITSTPTNRNN